ncbi:MAG TPA: Rieske 2Fe-2S domain-containing protein [Candidatus Nanoarchaeia archaeon]|nr:Rieske 2Fe-2S domain-containing protein [Candidatus Nanoarchaeia archaeon]
MDEENIENKISHNEVDKEIHSGAVEAKEIKGGFGWKWITFLTLAVIVIIFLFVRSNDNGPTSGAIKEVGEDNYIAELSDISLNSMKTFTYNNEPAILVNFDGEIKAYLNKCPHKGLQFDENSLINSKIQCPWHGATFQPATGDYLGNIDGNNYGLSGLTIIDLRVENGKVYVK